MFISILEIGGLNKQDTHSLLLNAGKFYARTLKLVLEDPEITVLNLTSESRELLALMLDQDTNNRPKLDEILERTKVIESKQKCKPKNVQQEEEKNTSVDTTTTTTMERTSTKKKIKIIEDNDVTTNITFDIPEIKCLELRKLVEDPNPLDITTVDLRKKFIGDEGVMLLSKKNFA